MHPSRASVLLLLLFAAVVPACATSSAAMAPPDEDKAARTLPPRPGYGTLYVFRDETYGFAMVMNVQLNDQMAGETGSHTFFRWDLRPGDYVIRSATNLTSDASTLRVTITPGTYTFVWQEVKTGLLAGRPLLHLVDTQRGTEGLRSSKLIHYFVAGKGPAPERTDAVEASAPAPAPPSGTLFQRVGGLAALTAISDEFVARLARDTRYAQKLDGLDRKAVSGALADRLCRDSGGSCDGSAEPSYRLFSAAEAHGAVEVFDDAANHFKVADRERRELATLIERASLLVRADSARR